MNADTAVHECFLLASNPTSPYLMPVRQLCVVGAQGKPDIAAFA